jgi:hypothetical protein
VAGSCQGRRNRDSLNGQSRVVSIKSGQPQKVSLGSHARVASRANTRFRSS